MPLFRKVETLEMTQQMRVLRNECASFMTNDSHEITEAEQEKFYHREIETKNFSAYLFYGPPLIPVAYALVRPHWPQGRGGMPTGCWLSAGVTERYRGYGYGKFAIGLITAVGKEKFGRVLGEARADNEASIRACHGVGFRDLDTYTLGDTEYLLMEYT